MQTALAQLIRDQIQQHGPQPFAWFMQTALYHPTHGYYASGRAKIGRDGDYFTNVSVGPLFGRLMTAQFAEIWERMGKIDNFSVVEQGAHDGRFALDVLEAAQQDQPEFFEALNYRIIEPFPIWQDRQMETLEGRALSRPQTIGTTQRPPLHDFRGKVEWCDEIAPFTGIHFSNELLDAMPLNLSNKLVGLNGDDLVFVKGETPKNSAIPNWIDSVAKNLQRGFIITVDYGFTGDQFREMIQVRAQHRLLDSPFEQIGHADITAHINWSDVARHATNLGLEVVGFTDQHHFLTGIISTFSQPTQRTKPTKQGKQDSLDLTALSRQVCGAVEGPKAKRELQTLVHPEMMGRTFQVLALAKDVDLVDGGKSLAGFKFARDATPTLAL